MAITFQIRRGAVSALPTGAAGEPLYTTDMIRFYIGTGFGNKLVGVLHNIAGSGPPGASDDAAAGYSPGSCWVWGGGGAAYVCLDATTSAAVWAQTNAVPAPPTAIGYDAENKDAATLDDGAAVTVHTSGTGVWKADASAAGYECVGLVAASTAPTFSADVLTTGELTLPDWTAATGGATLAPNAPYYLSATPGQITATPPTTAGHRVQQVGVAVSPTTLSIQILQPILL